MKKSCDTCALKPQESNCRGCLQKGIFTNWQPKDDIINKPDHYTAGGIETIDYMRAKMNKAQFEGYLLGNVIKYTSRFQHKNGIEDIKKSRWYIEKLIEEMESGENE